MFAFILRRAGQSVIAVIGLLVLVFFLSRLTGDPAYLYLPLDSSEAQRQAFSEAHGFNDPLVVQFGRYLVDLARFDFGDALSRNRPAMEVALEAFPQTLKLAAIAIVLRSVLRSWSDRLPPLARVASSTSSRPPRRLPAPALRISGSLSSRSLSSRSG